MYNCLRQYNKKYELQILHQLLNNKNKILDSNFLSYLAINIVSHLLILLHPLGVYVEDLHTTLFVGQADLHLHLESTGPHQRLVNHIASVGHTDYQDIVQLVHTCRRVSV